MNCRRVLASLPIEKGIPEKEQSPEAGPSTPHQSRGVRQAALQAFRMIDELNQSKGSTGLRKVVEKLAHAAEYGLTEGLIQRQRAQDLEKALIRRGKETKGKKTLSTIQATTGAELLKLRDEFDKIQLDDQSPSRKPRRPVHPFKTPSKPRVRFVKSPRCRQKASKSSASGSRDGVSDSDRESVASGNLSEGDTVEIGGEDTLVNRIVLLNKIVHPGLPL